MITQFFVSLLTTLVIFCAQCQTSDPHESMSRRTPSGIPYYLNTVYGHDVYYTASSLLILEYGSNSTSSIEIQQPSPSKEKSLSDATQFYSSVLENCRLGELFQGFYMSEEEKEQFLKQLNNSCFKDRWHMIKVGNLPVKYYDEPELWNQVLSDCKSKRIPDSLIAPDLLNNLLTDFRNTILMREGLQLSFPLTDKSTYYKVELASCAFSKNSFILALQIPVKLISEDDGIPEFHDYNLIPIPLWMPDEPVTVCRLEERSPSFPFDIEGLYHYNFKSGEILHERNLLCHASGINHPLCFLPNSMLTKRSMKKGCAQAIIESQDEDIICDLRCESAAIYNLPVIRKVASDRYMIVTDLTSNEDIRIECPPFQKEETLTFPTTGTLEVILPCDCHIRYRKSTFNATSPCGAEFSKITIPFPGNYDSRDVSDEQS